MRSSSFMLQCAGSAMLMFNVACADKMADEHVWDNYTTTPAPDQTYIDNDEYYVAPTGGYVSGASSGILDAD